MVRSQQIKRKMMNIKQILFISFVFTNTIEIFCSSNNGKFSNSNVYRLESIQLVEEPPIGTLVIDLASKLDITDLATSDYKFRFYSPHSLTAHYFLIDQLTGHVKTQRSLDREYLCETKACGPCQNGNNCTIPIEIVASTHMNNIHKPGGSNSAKFVSFDVVIEDKNEFAPQFPRDSIVINISENTPANFTVPLDPAVDRDSRQTNIYYSLIPVMLKKRHNEDHSSEVIENLDDDQYETELRLLNSKIRLSTSPSNSQTSSSLVVLANPSSSTTYSNQQLNLVIIEPFDYETDKEMYFKILASDGVNQPYLTGSCLVTLRIVDLNDNLPVFDKQEYEYRLDEDKATADTRLIRVHASDRDSGPNGLVKYYLVDQTITTSSSLQQPQSIQIKNLFQIDELTGWISVAPSATSLDFEQISVYRLTVRAQDSGVSNSMPVYTNVVVYLNDVNDNRPVISLTVPSDEFDLLNSNSINELEISEWTLPDTFLAQVVVSDLDSGLNAKLKLEMSQIKRKANSNLNEIWTSAEDFVLTHLFNNIYSLMTKNFLDREQFDLYSLNITVSDYGQPNSLSTSHLLSIKIKDENDNSPVFMPIANVTKLDKNKNVMAYNFEIFEETTEKTLNEWIKLGKRNNCKVLSLLKKCKFCSIFLFLDGFVIFLSFGISA